ncbi:CCAAT-binding factor complex subunit Php5 [Schizosaccharomyces japonicus yFS275]|uniref:CCAAT-binding factor complex subunit Php5 n=1 Tax=Schizosaccharomyces japonicus (strain yFS275 / FY16936) TaxID=402676 RepID=B6JXD4_SCHJY|nr:CCAAT-binding factor complex subunit Php5 [Schizosaccharomyces japonicus yFS275]EEB06035.1 CCAAT-binding factor complex subunit Php5 [Schizosaccharomyces japonicus yFS275]
MVNTMQHYEQPVVSAPPPSDYSGLFENVTKGLSGSDAQVLADYWQRMIDNLEMDNQNIKTLQLPLARIKKVMKTDDDVKTKMISAEAPFLFAKGSEIFITELTMRAWLNAKKNQRRTLQRLDIANAISKSEMFDFLIDIISKDESFHPRTNDSHASFVLPGYQQGPTSRASPSVFDQIRIPPSQMTVPSHPYALGPQARQAPPQHAAYAGQPMRAVMNPSNPQPQYLSYGRSSAFPGNPNGMQETGEKGIYKQQQQQQQQPPGAPGNEPDYMRMPAQGVSDTSSSNNMLGTQRVLSVAPYLAEHLYRYPPTHLYAMPGAMRYSPTVQYGQQQSSQLSQQQQQQPMAAPYGSGTGAATMPNAGVYEQSVYAGDPAGNQPTQPSQQQQMPANIQQQQPTHQQQAPNSQQSSHLPPQVLSQQQVMYSPYGRANE